MRTINYYAYLRTTTYQLASEGVLEFGRLRYLLVVVLARLGYVQSIGAEIANRATRAFSAIVRLRTRHNTKIIMHRVHF